MSNKNAHVLVGGDFNCGNIEWSTMQVPEGVPQRQVQSHLFEFVQDHCLSQVVNFQTREDCGKTLDLLLTNSPSPVNRVKGMPPIGKADHDIVYIEYDIKAMIVRLSLLRKTILIPEYLAFMCVCVFVDGCISQF